MNNLQILLRVVLVIAVIIGCWLIYRKLGSLMSKKKEDDNND